MIQRQFSDQKHMKKYVKKEYIQVYDERMRADGAKSTCHTLTDKLIDFSQRELVVGGYIESTTGNALAKPAVIGIQNGFHSVPKDTRILINNNEDEHNREQLFTTTFQNLPEYCPDYASSVSVQYGFIKDTDDNVVAAIHEIRNCVSRDTFTYGELRYTVTIALSNVSQFVKRCNFPIMNQLFKVEFKTNNTQSIIRTAAQQSRFVMTDATLFVPEVALPTKEI